MGVKSPILGSQEMGSWVGEGELWKRKRLRHKDFWESTNSNCLDLEVTLEQLQNHQITLVHTPGKDGNASMIPIAGLACETRFEKPSI